MCGHRCGNGRAAIFLCAVRAIPCDTGIPRLDFRLSRHRRVADGQHARCQGQPHRLVHARLRRGAQCGGGRSSRHTGVRGRPQFRRPERALAALARAAGGPRQHCRGQRFNAPHHAAPSSYGAADVAPDGAAAVPAVWIFSGRPYRCHRQCPDRRDVSVAALVPYPGIFAHG